ncbi:MAG: biopolymer transporter ExbD [Bdellovibrionales bacterium]|jgi:biopolymer transport protein ExbD|nr:biopolymer transporter ExbD [Bdellovibrionales bacterium]
MADSGSKVEKIKKPGYHIRPKYDLHGLRRRRTDNSKGHISAELPLTAMIDLFSSLVIFLLMNFSATGDAFFMSRPGIVLPSAGKTISMESAPLISYQNGAFFLDALKPEGGQIRLEDRSDNLQNIVAALKSLQDEIKRKAPKEFNGQLNVQADENTQLLYIKRAMGAGTSAGWTSINFVVTPKGQ